MKPSVLFQSGPISATLTLPRTAFVPGETVPIAAEADNKSSREVKSSSVKLVQTITYHAQGRSEVGTHFTYDMLYYRVNI